MQTQSTLLSRTAATALVVVGVSCAGLSLVDVAWTFGTHILKATVSNYTQDAADKVEKALRSVAEISKTTVNAAGSASNLPPIELNISLLKEAQFMNGDYGSVPINDGDIAFDDDSVKIVVSSNVNCYLYIAWADGTGWVDVLFPFASRGFSVSRSNPIQADEPYYFPEGNNWLGIDDHPGIENCYFIASRQPLRELEVSFGELARLAKPNLNSETAETVDEPDLMTRGLAGERPGHSTFVPASDGNQYSVVPVQFYSPPGADALVVTRHFRHLRK